MEISSSLTLEKIVQEDQVNDQFRSDYLIEEGTVGFMMGCGGLAFTIFSVMGFVKRENVDFVDSLIGVGLFGGALVLSLCGYQKLARAIKIGRHYCQEKALPPPKKYHYLKEKVTNQETVVEREYGQPVIVASSLKQLGTYQDSLMFIDHLVLTEAESSQTERDEETARGELGEQIVQRVTYHFVSFTLERGSERGRYHYSFRGMMPKEFTPFLAQGEAGKKGQEFALLLKQVADADYDNEVVPFLPEKVYFPHP